MSLELSINLNGREVKIKDRLELGFQDPLNTEEGTCLPETIEVNKFYKFRLRGFCIFPLGETIRLFDRDYPKKPLANIEITQQTVFLLAGSIQTSGEYYIKGVYKY